jgi:hypothetical protein
MNHEGSGGIKGLLESTTALVSNIFGSRYPLVNVKSTIDNKTYKVRDMPDKQAAADLLAKLRLNISKLYLYLESKVPDKPQVVLLKKNFKPDSNRFFESTPDAEHTSYSVNKGEAVHMCLRQRGGITEELVAENVIMFVGLHEMAHMITPTIGHDPQFWNNFGWLLEQAEKIGVYKHTNFKEHPVPYCGVKITDMPDYDPSKDVVRGSGSGSDFSIGTMISGKDRK